MRPDLKRDRKEDHRENRHLEWNKPRGSSEQKCSPTAKSRLKGESQVWTSYEGHSRDLIHRRAHNYSSPNQGNDHWIFVLLTSGIWGVSLITGARDILTKGTLCSLAVQNVPEAHYQGTPIYSAEGKKWNVKKVFLLMVNFILGIFNQKHVWSFLFVWSIF